MVNVSHPLDGLEYSRKFPFFYAILIFLIFNYSIFHTGQFKQLYWEMDLLWQLLGSFAKNDSIMIENPNVFIPICRVSLCNNRRFGRVVKA